MSHNIIRILTLHFYLRYNFLRMIVSSLGKGGGRDSYFRGGKRKTAQKHLLSPVSVHSLSLPPIISKEQKENHYPLLRININA